MSASPEVLIIGAGPAGATAAICLAEAGIASVLLDDNPRAGGQIFRADTDDARDLPGVDPRGAALRAALARHAQHVDHRAGHEAIAIHPGPCVWARGTEGRIESFTPRFLVIATGALEVSVPVPGWDLPGVYALGGLQLLLKGSGLVPAAPVVLGGAGPLLYLVAAQLLAAGAPVAAVVDAAPPPNLRQLTGLARRPGLLARGLSYVLALHRARVPVLRRHAVIAVEGEGRAQRVVVAPLDADWRPRADGHRTIAAEIVGLGHGLRPNTELTQLAGCRHDFDPRWGGWHVRHDTDLATTVDGIFVAGDVAGIHGADAALVDGVLVADAIARRLGRQNMALAERVVRARARLPAIAAFRDAMAEWSGLRPGIFAATTPETVVCLCEGVTRADLDRAFGLGLAQPRGVKLATRAGMGLCQGRTCAPAVQHLTALGMGVPVADVDLPTVRPPVRPVPAGAFAAAAATP